MDSLDLTTEKGVVQLMQSASSESDWNNRAYQVKDANGGDYPEFWFSSVILSGVASRTQSRWNRNN